MQVVAQPVRGLAEVVATVDDSFHRPFVRDRPDGSKAVFFSSQGDIYKVIDR